MDMDNQADMRASTRHFSEAELRQYFSTVPSIPSITVVLVVAGILFSLAGLFLRNGYLLAVGIVVISLGGIIIISRTARSKPTDQEYDTWLESQARMVMNRAIAKLGLDPSEIIREPLRVHGFVLPGTRDATGYRPDELKWKVGADRVPRFSVNVYIYFFPADHHLAAFVGDVNVLNQSAHNEMTAEYFYRDIVGATTSDEQEHITLKDKQYQYRLQRFALRISSGDSIGISVSAVPLDNRQGAPNFTIPDSGIDQTVAQLRYLLREKKQGGSSRSPSFNIEQRIENLLKSAANGMLTTNTTDLQDQMANLIQGFAAAVGLRVLMIQSSKEFTAFFIETGFIFENIRIPTRLPFIIGTDYEISDETLDQLRLFLLSGENNYETQVAILILFCDRNKLSLAKQRFANNRLGNVHALDIVVLNHENLLEIASALEPDKVLCGYVLSQMNLVAIAPYTVAGPTPPKFFFGREHELREIADHLATTSYILIGSRRIGKTSMLNRLHCVRLPSCGFHTLSFDCSTISTYQAFLSAPIRDWKPEPPINAPATFEELFRCPPNDKPVVLLLDEADKIVPMDRENGWRLFNTLRALVNAGHVQIVLSGERTLREALKDSTSPLFNFANLRLLGPLDRKAIEQLVTGPMKKLGIEIVNQMAVVNHIYEFTSGHPNVVQRLCQRLIERLNEQGIRRITLDDVRTITEDPHFQEYDFLQTYWEGATPLEQIITLVLSHEVKGYHLKDVRQMLSEHAHIQPGAVDTKGALDRLVELRSILKHTQNGYEFAVKAFPLVLENTTTVGDLLDVLVENYNKGEHPV